MNCWEAPIQFTEMSRILQRYLGQHRSDKARSSYVFHDMGLMSRRIEELHRAFPQGSLHAMAIKANPLMEVLRFAVEAGMGLEAASLEEVHLALAAECAPSRIVYDSPAKSLDDLQAAIDLGVCVNADHLDELQRIDCLLTDRPPDPSRCFGVRINPQVGAGAVAVTSVGTRNSRFGLPWDWCQSHGIDLFQRYPWLNGLHLHVGSQGCSLDQLVQAAQRIMELRRSIEAACGSGRIQFVDLGGGLPTTYLESQPALPLTHYVESLERHVPGWRDSSLRIVTEFGRALLAHCGWAVSRIEYTKRVHDTRYAVMHLGADFMLRTAYLPQDWPHRFAVLDPLGNLKTTTDREPWTLAGPLCFAGDILASETILPAIDAGDWILIADVGAYTLSMWSRHCSRGMPPVIGYRNASDPDFALLRMGESPADVVKFWSA